MMVPLLFSSGSASGAASVRRHLHGIHAITAGTTFSKAALLAELWMSGVDPLACEVDLYLVAGGAGARVSRQGSTSWRSPGAGQGGVRIVESIPFAQIIDGSPIAVGAGGLGAQMLPQQGDMYGANGGDTIFGGWRARGGLNNGFPSAPNETSSWDYSDITLGKAGLFRGSSTFQGALDAEASFGPGAGGGLFYQLQGAGGTSNLDRADLRRLGGSHLAPGSAGQSAPAASLMYGGGGAGSAAASNTDGGDGGFPGGGGGAALHGTLNKRSGSGGNGVIRLAVYEWRPV